MVRLVWSNDVATTMTSIQSMLRELATHYVFRIECLPPGDPEKKGKVERPMSYVRRLYQAHGNAWHGLDESQAYLDRKLEIANQRKHGTTREQPVHQFKPIEQAALKSLPALAYEPETFSLGIVRRDGHVRLENKYYSLPETFIGKKVVLLGGTTHVSIYCEGRVIETHERVTSPYQSKSTKLEHLKPWEREMRDDSLYRKRAKAIGLDVDRFGERVIARGHGFIDTRKIWGVLSLDKTFPKDRINEACRQAIELDSLSYRMVKRLCKLTDTADPSPCSSGGPNAAPESRSHSHKFVRPLSVYEAELELDQDPDQLELITLH